MELKRLSYGVGMVLGGNVWSLSEKLTHLLSLLTQMPTWMSATSELWSLPFSYQEIFRPR